MIYKIIIGIMGGFIMYRYSYKEGKKKAEKDLHKIVMLKDRKREV